MPKITPPQGTTSTGTQPDPTQTVMLDPEILPKARDMTARADTREGDVAKVSLDFTLSEEGKGDNISGNKLLRGSAEHEDETNSKRPKVPLYPPTSE